MINKTTQEFITQINDKLRIYLAANEKIKQSSLTINKMGTVSKLADEYLKAELKTFQLWYNELADELVAFSSAAENIMRLAHSSFQFEYKNLHDNFESSMRIWQRRIDRFNYTPTNMEYIKIKLYLIEDIYVLIALTNWDHLCHKLDQIIRKIKVFGSAMTLRYPKPTRLGFTKAESYDYFKNLDTGHKYIHAITQAYKPRQGETIVVLSDYEIIPVSPLSDIQLK